jgi:hypothetical protein
MVALIVTLLPQHTQVDAEPPIVLMLSLVAFLVGWLLASLRRHR